MKLPKNVYIKIDGEGDEQFLHAQANPACLVDMGEKVKIGIYKLVGTQDIEGVFETSNSRKA